MHAGNKDSKRRQRKKAKDGAEAGDKQKEGGVNGVRDRDLFKKNTMRGPQARPLKKKKRDRHLTLLTKIEWINRSKVILTPLHAPFGAVLMNLFKYAVSAGSASQPKECGISGFFFFENIIKI